MTDLPTGTVTFLLTDVEGSTRLWEEQPETMSKALAAHYALIERVAAEHGGVVVKSRGEGDSSFTVFTRPTDAVRAVIDFQRNRTRGEDGPLTAREEEVARLLSTGLTNRRIAERLVVSTRTVDAHVDHIRNKLGLRRRAEIATWVTSRQGDGAPALRVRCAVHTGEAELRDGDYYGTAVNRCARLRSVAFGGQVLLSRTTSDLVSPSLPPGATLKDLGSHRLRDLLEPEHVFQLRHPELTDDFPPIRSLNVLPTNLPTQVASFVGRAQEIADIREVLGSARLATLTGTAGVGKTSLAVRVAAEVVDRYPDGVWFVELASVADPALIATVTASTLGIRQEAAGAGGGVQHAIDERLLDHLRTRTALLVLDNCEHLSDASARFADGLLRACPDVSVLATSREPLGTAGERVWRVPSLSVPDREDARAGSIQSDALRLFVERAQQVLWSFELTEENTRDVVEICVRLDGIPLAIELAAARVPVLTPNEIAHRLEDQFKLLAGGARTALERHQTMRAAIDWSYDHLDEPEKLLLDRLSVFVGGFRLDAAEAVCAGGDIDAEDVLDLVGSLARKSLLTSEERTGTSRYRLLETIRQYAREKLVARGEASEVRTRHFGYFMSLAEPARAFYPLSEEPGFGRLFDVLDEDHDNLRAAADWTAGTADGLRLTTALAGFWFSRGHGREARGRIERSLDAPDGAPLFRAQGLRAVAVIRLESGDTEAGQRLAEEALAISLELDDAAGHVQALEIVREVATRNTELRRARAIADEAMAIARPTGNERVLHDALWMVGWSSWNVGDLTAARDAFQEAVAIDRRAGSPGGYVTWGLGTVAIALGDLDEAEARFAEGLEVALKEGYDVMAAMNLDGLSAVAAARGDVDGAAAHLERGMDVSRRSGMTVLHATGLGRLVNTLVGRATDTSALDRVEERVMDDADDVPYLVAVFGAMRALLEGRFEEGTRRRVEAGTLLRSIQPQLAYVWFGIHRFRTGYAEGTLEEADYTAILQAGIELPANSGFLAALAFTLAELGRSDEARVHLEALVQNGTVVGLPWDEYHRAAVTTLAQTCARVGDNARAEFLYDLLLTSSGQVILSGPAACYGAADRYLGMLAATMGRFDEAERHFVAAIQLEDALGARPDAAFTRYEYGRVLLERGETRDREKAVELLETAGATAAELGMRKLEEDASAAVAAART